MRETCRPGSRGRRECRMLCAPAAPCAAKKAHEVVTTGPPERSGIPCAMVLTVSFVISLVNRAFLPPSAAQCVSIVVTLTPASGRQDHTTSPSASPRRSSVGAVRVHRISLHVRDDREPPLSSGETGRAGIADLPDALSEIFFAARLDRLLVICPSGCFVAGVAWRSRLRGRRSSLQFIRLGSCKFQIARTR